jgi:hypothetical protein
MGTAISYYSNNRLQPIYYPETALTLSVAIAPSETIAQGTILGELTASPGVYGPYASGHTDGTQTAKVIAEYSMNTDAEGNITFSSTEGTFGGPYGETYTTAPVFYKGTFATGDLVGLDSTAVSALGRLIQGTTTSGILELS